MKRVAALLLFTLIFASSILVNAQRMSPEENARQSQQAARAQQKMLHKKNKQQAKATRKYEKAQRKQVKKANRDLARRRQGSGSPL